MRTDKKSSSKGEKKSTLRGFRQDTMGYGKKTALLEEAITQMNAGKYGRSSAVLKELLALDPHNMEARRLFATLHLRLGSLIPARQAFDSLIDEAFERQDYWLAESLLREYLAAGPRCVPFLEKLGFILANKGESLEAVTEYGKAIEILIEDPDPDHPSRASELYKTIVDLAPASPIALRLAGCFDVQTGEVIARLPTSHSEEDAEEQSDFSVASESLAGSLGDQPLPSVMSWERVGYVEEKSDDPESIDAESALLSSILPAPSVESSVIRQEEDRYQGSEGPFSDGFSEAGERIDLESESVPAASEVSGSISAPEFQIPDGQPQAAQQDAIVHEVAPPMPWEDVREDTTDIPDQTESHVSGESPSISASEQEQSHTSQDISKTEELSWDPVSKNVWKSENVSPGGVPAPEAVQNDTRSVGEPAPSALAPVSMQEIDPGTIEIPEAVRLQAQLGGPADTAATPMPWDQVQESTITIPVAQIAELQREAEPVWASPPEPVVEQDLPLSRIAMPGADPETSAISFVEQAPAPPVSEPEVSPADVLPEQFLADDRAAEEITEPQPPVFSFPGEVAAPVEPAPSLSLPGSVPPPSFTEEVLSDTRQAETTFSLRPESTDFPVDTNQDQAAFQTEPASPVSVSEVAHQMTGSRVDQTEAPQSTLVETASQPEPESVQATPFFEEPLPLQTEQHGWQEPVATAAKTPLLDLPPKQDESILSGESIRFIGESHTVPNAEPELPEPAWAHQDLSSHTSAVAAAVDVLFESPGHTAQPEAETRRTHKLPRRNTRFSLRRLASAVSDFIASCFSTTRAIVTSLIGLVVLAGLCTGLGIGAVGLVWVIMEEPPSSTYRSMTTSPQRTLGDVRKNGYLVLLGFDVAMDQDPIQAGFERKPDDKDADRALTCLGGSAGNASVGQPNASAKVLNGWFKESNPISRFTSHRGMIEGWVGHAGGALSRYQQWHRLSFEDWGFGQAISPPCAAITFAQHLYLAEGFALGTDVGVDRIETDIEAWRIVLSQARTLPVKTLALQALNDDIALVSGLLVQPDVDGNYLGRLAKMVRPLDQAEQSLRWPMQSELVSSAKTFDAKLKVEQGEEQTVAAAIASILPLPEQRRLNRYADYYEASYRAAGEGRYGALPKWSEYIHFPAKTVMDHVTNPIENVVGLEPLAPWDLYNGLVIDTDAHLRLASLQAWIRRGSQDAELLPRIAKAGQNFYDPYTGLPMLVNLRKGVLYSVGHDGKDQDADPQADIVVAIPVNHAVAAALKASTATAKSR